MNHRSLHVALLPLMILAATLIPACSSDDPESHDPALLPSSNYHYTTIADSALVMRHTVYLPVYSDIYHMSGERRYPLTVTASVRNVSVSDSIYVTRVDYYDSQGKKQREYLKGPIVLGPLASVEFVVEHDENKGGAGANFLIDWGARDTIDAPVIQGVMIGTTSKQGISFVTEGVEVGR